MPKATRVQFVVDEFGDDPSVVTELIGFEPTITSACGFSSLSKNTSWLMELPEPVPEKVEDHIASLLRALEPHADGVRRVAAQFRARVSVNVDDRDWIWPYEPDGPRFGEFELSSGIIAAASRLGVAFTIQFSCGLRDEAK